MNLFFCGGIAKSGTTLLQRILNLHNDISCEFEDDLNFLLQEFIRIHKNYNLRINQTANRIGLKNDANQLNSGTFNSNGRKISSIKIKYGRL